MWVSYTSKPVIDYCRFDTIEDYMAFNKLPTPKKSPLSTPSVIKIKTKPAQNYFDPNVVYQPPPPPQFKQSTTTFKPPASFTPVQNPKPSPLPTDKKSTTQDDRSKSPAAKPKPDSPPKPVIKPQVAPTTPPPAAKTNPTPQPPNQPIGTAPQVKVSAPVNQPTQQPKPAPVQPQPQPSQPQKPTPVQLAQTQPPAQPTRQPAPAVTQPIPPPPPLVVSQPQEKPPPAQPSTGNMLSTSNLQVISPISSPSPSPEPRPRSQPAPPVLPRPQLHKSTQTDPLKPEVIVQEKIVQKQDDMLYKMIEDLKKENGKLKESIKNNEGAKAVVKENSEQALIGYALMAFELSRVQYSRYNPEDSVSTLKEDELRARLRKANVRINELEIEVDAVTRKLEQNRDREKEEMAEEIQQLKQEIDNRVKVTSRKNSKTGISPNALLGEEKNGQVILNDKEIMEMRRRDEQFKQLKADYNTLKKEMILLSKDRDAVVGKLLGEHDKFRQILRNESNRIKDQTKQIKDNRVVTGALNTELETARQMVATLREELEQYVDYHQIKAERDDLKAIIMEKQFNKKLPRDELRQDPERLGPASEVAELRHRNEILQRTVDELMERYNPDTKMIGKLPIGNIDSENSSQKFAASMIHNFLLSVENLRLMSVIKNLTTSGGKGGHGSKENKDPSMAVDQESLVPSSFELTMLKNENQRLLQTINQLSKELSSATHRADMTNSNNNLFETRPRSPAHFKYSDVKHNHNGLSCEEVIRTMRIENKKVSETLTQMIRENDQLKKQIKYLQG